MHTLSHLSSQTDAPVYLKNQILMEVYQWWQEWNQTTTEASASRCKSALPLAYPSRTDKVRYSKAIFTSNNSKNSQ